MLQYVLDVILNELFSEEDIISVMSYMYVGEDTTDRSHVDLYSVYPTIT